jgi:protein-disulfide isomerase
MRPGAALLSMLLLVTGSAAAQNLEPVGSGRVSARLLRALVEDSASPAIGNPRGRDIIVEFLDYRCPYCRALAPDLRRLVAEDREARLIVKEWPLFGGVSIYAARVALASAWQGKFDAVHAALLAARGPLDRDGVRQAAEGAGLDLARLDREMASRGAELDGALGRVEAQAGRLRLKGTPGLVIGGRVISGALSFDDLKSLIAQGRAPLPDETPAAGQAR